MPKPENSTVFSPRWTLDGTNPLTSGTAVISPAFTGGYLGNQIPVALANWVPASPTLTVRAAVRSLRPAIVTNSAIQQTVLTRLLQIVAGIGYVFSAYIGRCTFKCMRRQRQGLAVVLA